MTPPRVDWRTLLLTPEIAHRGLWTPGGAPENSLAAFRAARESGFGVELDVRLSADGEVMVAHDDNLARVTGQAVRVRQLTAAELSHVRLTGSDEGVPTLSAALEAIGPETLVLVELKTLLGQEGPLEAAVAEILEPWPGPAAVIGFNPVSHAWFVEHSPGLARGLNSYAYSDEASASLAPERWRAMAAFETVATALPHFILPGLDILASEPVARLRAEGLPVVAWTVRTPEERAFAAPLADNLIFEGRGEAGA